MKKTFLHLCFTILLILCCSGGFAQIIVDGDVAEWGDPKKMNYDPENKLYYTFKKDEQFLYMAIFKNQNEQKCKSGGVQLQFSDKKADTTGLQITFANSYQDPKTKKNYMVNNHETFTVKNLENSQKQELPTYNETGIMVEWRATNVEYIPKTINNIISSTKDISADPNIFTSEIQIPLNLLKKYDLNALQFSISLRGHLYDYKGDKTKIQNMYSNPKNIFETERLDCFIPTLFSDVFNIMNL